MHTCISNTAYMQMYSSVYTKTNNSAQMSNYQFYTWGSQATGSFPAHCQISLLGEFMLDFLTRFKPTVVTPKNKLNTKYVLHSIYGKDVFFYIFLGFHLLVLYFQMHSKSNQVLAVKSELISIEPCMILSGSSLVSYRQFQQFHKPSTLRDEELMFQVNSVCCPLIQSTVWII